MVRVIRSKELEEAKEKRSLKDLRQEVDKLRKEVASLRDAFLEFKNSFQDNLILKTGDE